METQRLSPVVFCGENPHIVLYGAGSETISAAASYWTCTYSAYGVGHVLLLHLDAANAAALNQPAQAIYSDNAPLAHTLTDSFNQHFDDWQGFGFASTPIQPAQFVKDSSGAGEAGVDPFYRVTCHSEAAQIDLLWQEMRGFDFRTFADLQGGGFGAAGDEHYHVANVIFLCGAGSIAVNGLPAAGEAQTRTLPNGRFSSSVFVALSETWIKIEPP
ncbi:MAG: hypothetical protein ABI835_09240 [Chloroflexota bacterium]